MHENLLPCAFCGGEIIHDHYHEDIKRHRYKCRRCKTSIFMDVDQSPNRRVPIEYTAAGHYGVSLENVLTFLQVLDDEYAEERGVAPLFREEETIEEDELEHCCGVCGGYGTLQREESFSKTVCYACGGDG